MKIEIERLGEGPIITPHMDARMGDNVNGPSLIAAPDWLPDPLGRYYLYFGHHDGRYIRLAYADALTGPWRTHETGVLPLAESLFEGHIASPDALVDEESRRIRLYYHGAPLPSGKKSPQVTRAALSADGLNFDARDEVLGRPYMRTVRHGDWHYSIAMPGQLYRSRDGLSGFEEGPNPFEDAEPGMRHAALLVRGDRLLVFYTRVGDAPERIVLRTIDLTDDWTRWRASPPQEILKPERDYEGADRPLAPSKRGLAQEPENQLRDPAVFEDDTGLYLLYSVAGEKGIGIARMVIVEGR